MTKCFEQAGSAVHREDEQGSSALLARYVRRGNERKYWSVGWHAQLIERHVEVQHEALRRGLSASWA